MAPHTQIPPDPNFPWYLIMFAVLKTAWDNVSHKQLLGIAGGIITILLFWGFNRTFNYQDKMEQKLERIEQKQDLARQDLKTEADKMHEANRLQDLCITEVRERQAVYTEERKELKKAIDELKKFHMGETNGPKRH